MNKVILHKNPNGDTRSAPKDVTIEQFRAANKSHVLEVRQCMDVLSQLLSDQGLKHDWTKFSYENEFYRDFLNTMNNGADFVSGEWWQRHIIKEKHHPFSKCHDDITLLDIIETIVDCVCAGKARSGSIRPLEFNTEILEKAVKNTVNLVNEMTVIEGENNYQKKCPLCGEKLDCEDIDYNFKGNQDEYSTCNHCHTSFLFYVRYGHVWKYDKTKMYFNESDKSWYCSEDPKNTETVSFIRKDLKGDN